ncbi:hypothetical protein H4Q26_012747 [Puccinia striiformis f. sp. tritici PST-130]|nr:hypothetical protein H4Q26_012747 [Puccinia striiformis f. sp. tritici PST-130]
MAHTVSVFILCSLLLLGHAFALSNTPNKLRNKATEATLGGIARIHGNLNVSGLFQFSAPEESDWVNMVISMRGLLQFNQTDGFLITCMNIRSLVGIAQLPLAITMS